MRNLLKRFDDAGGKYESRLCDHPEFGRLDYTHLPLDVLRCVSPGDFEKISTYQSFTLVRDPRDRFVSALSQHLKMYTDCELAQHDRADVNRLALQVMNAIQQPGATHHPEFIHFARQSEYIFCDGEQLIRHIYPMSRISDLVQALGQLTGEELGKVGNDNPTMVFRVDAFRKVAIVGKWASDKMLGSASARSARHLFRRILMKPLQNSHEEYMFSDDVTEFVRFFYEEDFDLYATVMKTYEENCSRA